MCALKKACLVGYLEVRAASRYSDDAYNGNNVPHVISPCSPPPHVVLHVSLQRPFTPFVQAQVCNKDQVELCPDPEVSPLAQATAQCLAGIGTSCQAITSSSPGTTPTTTTSDVPVTVDGSEAPGIFLTPLHHLRSRECFEAFAEHECTSSSLILGKVG
jgi:hypothetical protein